MKKTLTIILAVAFVFTALGLAQATSPSELKFPPLKYDPPDPKAFRTGLANGLRAYVQEDRSLGLVNITALVNFGAPLRRPRPRQGSRSSSARRSSAAARRAREGTAIEERIDFLGGSLNFMRRRADLDS